MSYLKSTRPTFQTFPLSISLQSVPAPMWLTVLYAEPTVGGGGGSSVGSDSHARYNDTVHDHRSQARPLKTQHNSNIDKTLLSRLPAYLFDFAGYRTLNVPAAADAVFANHTVVLRRKSYPSGFFFHACSSNLLGAKATKFSFTRS